MAMRTSMLMETKLQIHAEFLHQDQHYLIDYSCSSQCITQIYKWMLVQQLKIQKISFTINSFQDICDSSLCRQIYSTLTLFCVPCILHEQTYTHTYIQVNPLSRGHFSYHRKHSNTNLPNCHPCPPTHLTLAHFFSFNPMPLKIPTGL